MSDTSVTFDGVQIRTSHETIREVWLQTPAGREERVVLLLGRGADPALREGHDVAILLRFGEPWVVRNKTIGETLWTVTPEMLAGKAGGPSFRAIFIALFTTVVFGTVIAKAYQTSAFGFVTSVMVPVLLVCGLLRWRSKRTYSRRLSASSAAVARARALLDDDC